MPIGEFYHLVPKSHRENLYYRAKLLDACYSHRRLAAEAWEMCKRDLLFYLNAFCWLLEPREVEGPQLIPFITHAYQDNALIRVEKNLGKRDICFFKSRATGATWMVLYTLDHQVRFHPWRQCGLVSRNMEAVDKPNSQGALMSKLNFITENLPSFLGGGDAGMMHYSTSNHTITNLMHRGAFTGFPATGEAATGDRMFAVMMDEFHKFNKGEDYHVMSSTQHVTNSRLFISTIDPAKGESGAFFDVVTDAMNGDRDIELIEMSWMDDPAKAGGLYRSEDGVLEILDTEYEFPPDYPFVLDGKTRSIYYDGECRRAANPASIAAELDRDFGGSTQQFFDTQNLDQVKRQCCRPPTLTGRMDFDPDAPGKRPRFLRSEGGEMELWIQPDHFGSVPGHLRFVAGADVSSGRASETTSNSCLAVYTTLGEQAAELTVDYLRPDEFARLCVAVCRWFNGAILNWDATGQTGGAFTDEMVDLDYENIWYRPNKPDERLQFQTMKMGYNAAPKVGFTPVLAKFQRALLNGRAVPRSRKMLGECRQYIYKGGVPVHTRSVNTEDESSKLGAHGDRVIASALAIYTLQTEGYVNVEKTEPADDVRKHIPEDCALARRLRARKREENEAADTLGW